VAEEEVDALTVENDSSVDSLEDKIMEFMSENEDIWDKYYQESTSMEDTPSGEFSIENLDWWPDFNRWVAERESVDEVVSSEENYSKDEEGSYSGDVALEDLIQQYMSENEDSMDERNAEDSSSGEVSKEEKDWWSEFNRWLIEKENETEEEESSDVDFFTEELESSVDSLEDKIEDFLSENEDIWDKYYDESTSVEDTSGDFSMDKMDWWADFKSWLSEKESVDEVDSSEENDSNDEENLYSEEVSLDDLIRQFMSENEDMLDERNEDDSSSGKGSMEDKEWWSEFNRWLAEKEDLTSSIDESSRYGSSSEVGENFEEKSSSSDEPCEKGKGWFKGKIHTPIIITLIVFLAIIACLVIMQTKRKRDQGRRSMRLQMLSSGGIANSAPIQYLYKDNARKAEAKDDGPEYKAFQNLV